MVRRQGELLVITYHVLSTVTDTVTPAPVYDGITTLHRRKPELQDSGDLSSEANQLPGGRHRFWLVLSQSPWSFHFTMLLLERLSSINMRTVGRL